MRTRCQSAFSYRPFQLFCIQTSVWTLWCLGFEANGVCFHNTASRVCLESARLLSFLPAFFECVSAAVTWAFKQQHPWHHALLSLWTTKFWFIFFPLFFFTGPIFLFFFFTVMASSSCLCLSNDLLLINWLQNKSFFPLLSHSNELKFTRSHAL